MSRAPRESAPTAFDADDRLLRLLEASPIALCVADAASRRVLYANPKARELFGWSAELLATATTADVHDTPQEHLAIKARIDRDGGLFNHEILLKKSDGTQFWTLLDVQPVDFGSTPAIVAWFRDVTERKQAEIARRESEERFRDIASVASDWFWETDASLRMVYVSPRFFMTTGIPPQDILGRTRLEIAGFDAIAAEPEKWRTHMATLEARKPFSGFEYALRTPEGDSRTIRLAGTPSFDQRGRFLGYRGAGSDVTAAKQAEAALVVAKQAAETANRAKSDFLATMSHELRTPLNAIIGFSDLLRQEVFGALGDARYRQYAQDIQASGLHLLELINDILDLSRIEAGKMDLTEEPVDADVLISGALSLVEEQARRKNIALVDQRPAVPLTLHLDRRRMTQILLNLLSNAIKFTEPGGQVRLHVGLDDGQRPFFAVADTGIGMSPEEIEIALTPFAQVHGPLARREDGTGLGLSLSKRLAELHQGRLVVDSATGEGTRVTVTLPVGRIARQS